MKNFTLVLILLWLPSLVMGIDDVGNFFAWRHQLILLTGLLGLGYMCFAAVLAARFRWVEDKIKGLDKGYALHKKLGIGALVSLFLHWLLFHSAMWLIQAEVIAMPNRKHPQIEGINWHAIAEQVGDISFKVFVIFTIISLVQAISYKKFRFTHKIAGLLIFAGIFHAALLLDWNVQSIAMNLAIAILSIVGVICSWLSLTGKIGKNKKISGETVEVNSLGGQGAQDIAVQFSIRLDSNISYKEGQFAYLDFQDGEAPHPFSILNYDSKTSVIEFAVKDLGDYTHKLVSTLKAGQRVTVEGGYGCFQISDFDTQVWVGAGIGIVPFISRLYWLRYQADKQHINIKKIHLFYCVNSSKEAFFKDLIISIISHFDYIELHVLDAQRGEFLNGDKIIGHLGANPFDVSFCGPAPFAEKLQAALKLPDSLFHRELFKMR